MDDLDWKEAKEHLYEMKKAYEDLGWTGSFGLAMTINPIAKRYETGERTKELYDDIWSIE